MKNTAVFGIYSSRAEAESAVDRMIKDGFRSSDISALLADNEGTKTLAEEKNTKAPEGVTAGATSGAAVGGTLGLLAGLGALAIPGVGPLIAAGPVMAALAGMGTGGAVGGLLGGLVGMGIPEYEAKRYQEYVEKGNVLVSVHCDNAEWVTRAKEVLKQTGATDIASTTEAKVPAKA